MLISLYCCYYAHLSSNYINNCMIINTFIITIAIIIIIINTTIIFRFFNVLFSVFSSYNDEK